MRALSGTRRSAAGALLEKVRPLPMRLAVLALLCVPASTLRESVAGPAVAGPTRLPRLLRLRGGSVGRSLLAIPGKMTGTVSQLAERGAYHLFQQRPVASPELIYGKSTPPEAHVRVLRRTGSAAGGGSSRVAQERGSSSFNQQVSLGFCAGKATKLATRRLQLVVCGARYVAKAHGTQATHGRVLVAQWQRMVMSAIMGKAGLVALRLYGPSLTRTWPPRTGRRGGAGRVRAAVPRLHHRSRAMVVV